MGIVSTWLGHGRDDRRDWAEALAAACPLPCCLWRGDMLVVNAALSALASIATAQDLPSLLIEDDAAPLREDLAALDVGGKAFSRSVRTLSGGRVWQVSGSRGTLAASRAPESPVFFLTVQDVTEAERLRERLSEERDESRQEAGRWQTALDLIPMPLWMREAGGDLLWVNRDYADALGLTPAQVVAEQKDLPVTARARGVAGEEPRKLGIHAAESGEPQETRRHAILRGARRLLCLKEMPVPALGGTFGHARDVTREEELETEQSRGTAAHRKLLEQLGTAIGIFDAAQRLEFYNPAFSQLWGMDDQWLNSGPKLGDLMEKLREARKLPEQADFRSYKQEWMTYFTSLIDPHEDMLYLPDGKALRMLAVPHPMGGLMMTFEDVTSRLELESSYNTLIAVQKETLDNLSEGVAAFSGDGRLRLWNPAFARMWALHPEDLDGQPHVSTLAQRIQGAFREDEREARRSDLIDLALRRESREGRLETADGTLLQFVTVPLPDGGVLISLSDVTASVRVENALREKNAALEAAERLKLDFLANVSYQLRTPLNAIMGFSEILGNEYFGSLNDRQKEYTSNIHEAGERLLSLIDDILDLSTIEAGYMVLHPDEMDVADMLRHLETLTTEWARKESITVACDIAEALPPLIADERRLKQVMLNLIRNAIAFTPPGGRITLLARALPGGGGVEMAVRDTGVGISAQDQDRIFEPFEKVQQHANGGQPARGGAGLGLSLVRSIAALHGGSVDIQSAPGAGTTISLRIPQGVKTSETH